MIQKTREHAKTLGGIALILIVLPFAVFAIPQLIGATHGFVVLSDSMTPTMQAGDVVIVDKVAPEKIQRGDIITYHRPGHTTSSERTTHRVIDIKQTEEGLYFELKGDANEEPDPNLVPADNIIGRVVLTIPLIGHVIVFAGTRIGILTLVIVPSGTLLLLELRRAWSLLREDETADDTTDEQQPATTDSSTQTEVTTDAPSID